MKNTVYDLIVYFHAGSEGEVVASANCGKAQLAIDAVVHIAFWFLTAGQLSQVRALVLTAGYCHHVILRRLAQLIFHVDWCADSLPLLSRRLFLSHLLLPELLLPPILEGVGLEDGPDPAMIEFKQHYLLLLATS